MTEPTKPEIAAFLKGMDHAIKVAESTKSGGNPLQKIKDERTTLRLFSEKRGKAMSYHEYYYGAESEIKRCPTCGAIVNSIFDHIDVDCGHEAEVSQ